MKDRVRIIFAHLGILCFGVSSVLFFGSMLVCEFEDDARDEYD
jgi:hypothetical protein